MANSETYPVLMFGPAPVRYMGVVGSATADLEVPGISEIGTGTATAFRLGASPYVGARCVITQMGTATGGKSVVTYATTDTVNGQGNRTITLTGQGQNVELIGVSTTRWAVVGGDGLAFS